MLIKIFTLRFQTTLDAFDDTLFVEFIKDKSVLSLKEYFFQKNEIPYLALIVTYEPVQASNILGFDKSGASQKKKNDKWRTLLKESDMPLFETLRSWRAEYCKKEGMPPYVVCNNTELAHIVIARPQTLAGLMKIKGVGKQKAEKYGVMMLEILKNNIDTKDTIKEPAKNNDNKK